MRFVCIHSTGLSGRQWNSLKAALTGHQVLAPDLLGYGNNEWDKSQEYDLDTELAPLEALMVEPCVLVGHSCGGFLAMKLAARHPEKVKGLIVYDPIAWGVLASAESEYLEEFRKNEVAAREEEDEQWLPRFVEFWGGPGGWHSASESTRQYMRRKEAKIKTEVRTLIHDQTPHTEYLRITCPIILAGGRESPELEREVVRILSEALPSAETVWMDSGHMGPILIPDEFNALVVDFLGPVDIQPPELHAEHFCPLADGFFD